MLGRVKDEKGLTVIEVMLTLVIFSIVSLMAFRLMDFSLESFRFGVDEVSDRGNLRLTAYKITETVRNARQVALTDDGLSGVLDEYIYLQSNGTVHHNDEGTDLTISDDLIQTVTFTLTAQNGKYLLTIYLEGQDNELTTDVLLNNITSATEGSNSVVTFNFDAP